MTVESAPRLQSLTRGTSRFGSASLPIVIAALVGVVVWSMVVAASDGWVPSVSQIAVATWEALGSGETYQAMFITLYRVAIGFVAAFVIGTAVGLAMGMSSLVDRALRPLLVISLATPDPVYFIVALLAIGASEGAAMVAMVIALAPFIVTIVRGSVAARDARLDEMSEVYRLSRVEYWRQVLLPQLASGFGAAARTGFGFAWKIAVLMEALALADGIGAEIYYAFRLLQSARMLALALLFIFIMRAIDRFIFVPIERRAMAWRRTEVSDGQAASATTV